MISAVPQLELQHGQSDTKNSTGSFTATDSKPCQVPGTGGVLGLVFWIPTLW